MSTPKRPKRPPPKKMEFLEELLTKAKKAEIIFPLYDSATKLLATYADPESKDQANSLLNSVKRMISMSEKLCDAPPRGVVLKCNNEIAAKIIRSSSDYTEYTAIQYLALYAPDVPAPKPHGFIMLSGVRIILMTYFPSMTLEQAWPNLTHENKLSIQQNLDDILCTLRRLKQLLGSAMGGVNGEGVQDRYMNDHKSQQINTASAFEDFQFSVDTYPPSPAWTNFLRSFLPPSTEGTVFTHGDVRTANIMAEPDVNGHFMVTGIIDWETSGFYPDYFEATQILHLFNRNVESDWYQYVPPCISLARHPE